MNRRCALDNCLPIFALFASAHVGFAQGNKTEPYIPPSALAAPVAAQQNADPRPYATPNPTEPPSDYVLGPFDQINVVVNEFEDQFSDKMFRLDGKGDVTLPLAGR